MPLPDRDGDQQVLVDNEQLPARDRDYHEDDEGAPGGLVHQRTTADDKEFVEATLPEPQDHSGVSDFHNVELQRAQAQVLISEAPPDHHNFTYIVFYLLGTATMTPWNFFVTAEDYWMYKFRNTSHNGSSDLTPDLTPLQKSFTCDLTLTASISGTTFLILNAIYGQRVPLRPKVLGTLILILLAFLVTTGFVEVNTDQWQEQFFLITLFTVVLMNICSATMSGGVLGVAGLFPSEYMTAVVSGQALGGVFTALTFIMVLAFGTEPKTTAFIYFVIGSLLILVNIVCYVIMERRPFFQYYSGGGDKFEIVIGSPAHSGSVDRGVILEPNISVVFGKIYVYAAAICLLFTTTLSVYPGVTVLMQSQDHGKGKPWNDIYYLPVVNYLFFNTGDYFGRILAGVWEKPRNNEYTVLLLTMLRMLYIPFFLCSNSSLHIFLPTLVHTDVVFMAMMVTFALSNGYLANIILISTPRSVLQHEKEMASSIMAATLSCGLALGSMLSMVFVQML